MCGRKRSKKCFPTANTWELRFHSPAIVCVQQHTGEVAITWPSLTAASLAANQFDSSHPPGSLSAQRGGYSLPDRCGAVNTQFQCGDHASHIACPHSLWGKAAEARRDEGQATSLQWCSSTVPLRRVQELDLVDTGLSFIQPTERPVGRGYFCKCLISSTRTGFTTVNNRSGINVTAPARKKVCS